MLNKKKNTFFYFPMAICLLFLPFGIFDQVAVFVGFIVLLTCVCVYGLATNTSFKETLIFLAFLIVSLYLLLTLVWYKGIFSATLAFIIVLPFIAYFGEKTMKYIITSTILSLMAFAFYILSSPYKFQRLKQMISNDMFKNIELYGVVGTTFSSIVLLLLSVLLFRYTKNSQTLFEKVYLRSIALFIIVNLILFIILPLPRIF